MDNIVYNKLHYWKELIRPDDALKNSFLKEMTIIELKKYLAELPDFEPFYRQLRRYRCWVLSEKIRIAKYNSITYEDAYRCFRLGPLDKSVIQEYFTAHPEYKELHKKMERLMYDYATKYNLTLPAYMGTFNYIDRYIKIFLKPDYTTLIEFAAMKIDERICAISPELYQMMCEIEDVERLRDIFLQDYYSR